MDNYHVNPKTLNVGKCRARAGECPFGGSSSHHSTKEEALAFAEEISTLPITKSLRKSVSVFRAGSLEPIGKDSSFDDLDEIISAMDAHVPPGRNGRRGSLFASPNLKSHGRWLRGVRSSDSHEIKVDPNEVYVYPVRLYEDASRAHHLGNDDKFRQKAKEYWDSGMTLAEWEVWSEKNRPERGSWEVLLTPDSIKSSKPVSNRRIIENVEDRDADELNFKLEPTRARKGIIWRKNDPA